MIPVHKKIDGRQAGDEPITWKLGREFDPNRDGTLHIEIRWVGMWKVFDELLGRECSCSSEYQINFHWQWIAKLQ